MLEVYFESNTQSLYEGLYLAIFCFFLVPILYLYWGINKNKVLFNKKSTFYFFVMILGFTIVQAISHYQLVLYSEKIKSGEFLIVEGEISELKIIKGNSREESFKVNGVYFKYNDFGTEKMFFANRNHDSQLIKNGRNVNIHYLQSESENLIFKVSVVE